MKVREGSTLSLVYARKKEKAKQKLKQKLKEADQKGKIETDRRDRDKRKTNKERNERQR